MQKTPLSVTNRLECLQARLIVGHDIVTVSGAIMSGKIIAFRGAERAAHYRQAAEPRGSERQARLQLHLARISGLLEELEALKHVADSLPSPLALQARATIEKARSVMRADAGKADDRDPQPDIDRALLERMYRDLNPYA